MKINIKNKPVRAKPIAQNHSCVKCSYIIKKKSRNKTTYYYCNKFHKVIEASVFLTNSCSSFKNIDK